MSAERFATVENRQRLQVVLGTRGSELALIQARSVEKALREVCGADVRIEIIRTRGDVISRREKDSRRENLGRTSPESRDVLGAGGRKGVFTAELERALLEERIDVAVHSAKDLPSEIDSRLAIAAVLPRGPVEDVLITKTAAQFASLSHGATIASGSVRRQRQIRWLRPDLKVLGLRGNVPSRLRKFAASDWTGIMLARAGLERLGLFPPRFTFQSQDFFAEILPIELFLPAGGQGTIALQTPTGAAHSFSPVDDVRTHRCLRAEREFLRLLHGDCDLPVGVYARLEDGQLELRGQVFGTTPAPRMASARGIDPAEVAKEAFVKISTA